MAEASEATQAVDGGLSVESEAWILRGLQLKDEEAVHRSLCLHLLSTVDGNGNARTGEARDEAACGTGTAWGTGDEQLRVGPSMGQALRMGPDPVDRGGRNEKVQV